MSIFQFFKSFLLLYYFEIQATVLFVSSSIIISLFRRSNFCIQGFASNKYFWIVFALTLFDCNMCPVAKNVA